MKSRSAKINLQITILFVLFALIVGCKKDGGPVNGGGGQPVGIPFVHTNGPVGSLFYAAAGNNSRVLTADLSNVFLSTNSGGQWHRVSSSLTNLHFYSVGIASNGDLLVGTNRGLYISRNDGNTWTSKLQGDFVGAILTAGGRLFVGTYRGVYQSTNGGVTWAQSNNGLTHLNCLSLGFDSNGYYYAGTDHGVFRSTNGGANWEPRSNGLTNVGVRGFAFKPGGKIFIAGIVYGSGPSFGDVFYSSDNGGTWAQTNLTDNKVNDVAVGSNGDLFATTSGKFFRSPNDGATWQEVPLVPSGSIFTTSEIAVASSGTLFLASDGMLVSSDNGSSWINSSDGIANASVSSIAIGSDYIFTGQSSAGLSRSSNRGDSWSAINEGITGGGVSNVCISPSDAVFAGMSGGVFRSLDDGITWSLVGALGTTAWSVSATPTGTVLAGTKGQGVYRSVNNGNSWTQIPNPFQQFGLGVALVTIATAPNGHVFIGGDRMYRSTDDGSSWVEISSSGFTTSVVALSNGYILAGGPPAGILRSTDDGTTWEPTGFGGNSVSQLTANRLDHVFACEFDMIFRSTDEGSSWHSLAHIPERAKSLALDSLGFLYVGTGIAGVFRSGESSFDF